MRLEEIEKRMSEIADEVNAENADLDKLETELRSLQEEKTGILDRAEKRKNVLSMIANQETVEERKIAVPTDEQPVSKNVTTTPEYRSAWLKTMLQQPLTAVEKRSIASTDVAGAIPTQTADEIIRKVKKLVPLLNEITLLHVAGGVKFAVEGTVNAASKHAENAAITPAEDTLVTVTLAGYEIVKLIRISATVRTMTIDAFETWITDQLAESIARVIENYIINGTGSGEPKGINALTYTSGTNAVEWVADAPTFKELLQLAALLPAGYDRNAKFLLNKKTFWTQIQSIRDDSKMPIVREDGQGGYVILGYPAMISDYAADGDIFLGDFKKVVANLAQNIEIRSSEHSGFATNSVDYRGGCIFDCTPALDEAFVKGSKASA